MRMGKDFRRLDAHYAARDIEARILEAVRAAGLNPEQRLSPEDLGALDHFHTGGLRALRELALSRPFAGSGTLALPFKKVGADNLLSG